MHRKLFAFAAVLGGLAVALGAFGAHGLERVTQDQKIIQGFRTGVQYQLYHVLALLLIAGLYDKFHRAFVKVAVKCFIAGILFFSGSLYLLTYLKIEDSPATNIVGPMTPIGGLLLIVGWSFLVAATVKRN